MKKFFLLASIAALAASTTVTAQRVRPINENPTEQYAKTKVTTDSTLTYIDSVSVGTNEAGVLEVKMVAYAKDTAYALTGIKKVRYNKRRGTLTLGSVIDEQTDVVDTPLGTSTWTIVAASNKIYIRIKGKDATSITWYSFKRRTALIYQ